MTSFKPLLSLFLFVLLQIPFSITFSQSEIPYRPFKQVNFNSDNSISSYEIYSYNRLGDLILIESYSNTSQIAFTMEYNYDDQGTLKNIEFFDPKHQLIKTNQFSFNDKSQLIEVESFNKENQSITELRYNYNPNNKIYLIQGMVRGLQKSEFQIEYNHQDQMIRIDWLACEEDDDNKQCLKVGNMEFIYNENGLIKKMIIHSANENKNLGYSITEFEEGKISPFAKFLFTTIIDMDEK